MEEFAPVERLSPLVVRVMGRNPGPFTLQGTNTYLVGRGPKRILIDTGEGKTEYLQGLAHACLDDGVSVVVDQIIITHWHHDHVGGVPSVRQTMEDCGCKVRVMKYPSAEHDKEAFVPLTDGMRIHTEGATLRAVHTPGHAADHCCLLLEEENTLFSGDCVLGAGTSVFENLREYMGSLERLVGLNATRIYPGHGPVISEPATWLRQYISHRTARETQIIEVLQRASGPLTIEEIVTLVYPGLAENLIRGARNNVNHHLTKLVEENKAVRHGDGDDAHYSLSEKLTEARKGVL
eukprot:m.43301 g.43301  ORF g.43301 m.43301 type:complete len:293 (+) comp10760_c0_seq2:170-1048(+)